MSVWVVVSTIYNIYVLFLPLYNGEDEPILTILN